jgi:hypothetical protein
MHGRCPTCEAVGSVFAYWGGSYPKDLFRFTYYVASMNWTSNSWGHKVFWGSDGAQHTHYDTLGKTARYMCSKGHTFKEFFPHPDCDAVGCVWKSQLEARSK